MKLIIDKNRKVYSAGTWGTKNENNYEILDFEFPTELDGYNKRIVYYLGDERVWDAIVNNKAYITNAITKYEKVNAYVWLTKNETITLKYVCDGTEEGNYYFTYDNVNYYFTMPEVKENDELIFDVATSTLKLDNTTIATTSIGVGTELTFETIIDAEEDFRTQLFEMQFYENENADGVVPTPVQVDGFNTMLTAMNAKIDEVDALEQTIGAAEAQRQEAEATRVTNENTRESNESTRESNEQTRQTQEAERERRTDEAIANIEDKTAEYNANAEAKTTAFNNNATQKTNDFNTNASSKETAFNSNASSKTSAFNSNAETKTNAFNTNATNKTNDFNSNASSKTTAFNSNATDKTTNFDNNAGSKTTTFNENATSKTNDFNDNATAKTTAFNNNAQAKTEAFDEHTAEITDDIEDLQQEVEELSENMPWNETEQATEIDITDAAKYSKNKLELFGNTSQASLPTGYTALDHIESTGTQYIDTGILSGSNIEINTEFSIKNIENNRNYIFGAYGGGGKLRMQYSYSPNSVYGYDTTFAEESLSNINTNKHIINLKNGIFKLDNSTVKTINYSVFKAATVTIFLFGSNAAGTVASLSSIKLYNSKIYENDIIVRDFIPCKNDNNEVGLYDLVSQTFFGNAGIGDFVAGNEITIPNPDYPQDIHVVSGNNTISVGNTNYPINLGSIELCKIGSKQDYFYKENGNWYKYGAIRKLVLNGSETWNMSTQYTDETYFCAYYGPGNLKNNTDVLCNKLKYGKYSASSRPDYDCIACMGNTLNIQILLSRLQGDTLNDLKTWLSSNNLTLYTILLNPTITQITDETLIAQLDAIYEHLQLVKGTNNITVTAEDLAPNMQLSYMQDLPTKLNNLASRIELLEE